MNISLNDKNFPTNDNIDNVYKNNVKTKLIDR